jgi:hypothetical protein
VHQARCARSREIDRLPNTWTSSMEGNVMSDLSQAATMIPADSRSLGQITELASHRVGGDTYRILVAKHLRLRPEDSPVPRALRLSNVKEPCSVRQVVIVGEQTTTSLKDRSEEPRSAACLSKKRRKRIFHTRQDPRRVRRRFIRLFALSNWRLRCSCGGSYGHVTLSGARQKREKTRLFKSD